MLAAVTAVATPALLRWLPIPPDEPDVAPFAELATQRFRWTVFAVSLITGGLFFSLTPPSRWLAWAALASAGVLLGLIDYATTFLPLRLNYLALALALTGAAVAAGVERDGRLLLTAIGAGVIAAGFFWLFWRFSGGQLALGDVRLAGVIGVVVGTGGAEMALWAFLLGTLAAAIWGLVIHWRRGSDGPFPYGPGLLLGPVLAVLVSVLSRLG